MGRDERPLTSGMHDPQHGVVEVELYFERDHPINRYYRLPGGVMQPITDTVGKEDTVTRHRPMNSRTRLAGSFPEAQADPPPRPV